MLVLTKENSEETYFLTPSQILVATLELDFLVIFGMTREILYIDASESM